jgi:hypothetical protein
MTLEEYKKIVEAAPIEKHFTLEEAVTGLMSTGYGKQVKHQLNYALPQFRVAGFVSRDEYWAAIKGFSGPRKNKVTPESMGTITLTIPDGARSIWASVAKKKNTTVQALLQDYLIKRAEGLRVKVEQELEKVRQEYLEDFCSSVEL